jgi:hypothetical protein
MTFWGWVSFPSFFHSLVLPGLSKKEENTKKEVQADVSTTSFDIAWTAPKATLPFLTFISNSFIYGFVVILPFPLFIYLLRSYFWHFPRDRQASKRYKYTPLPLSLSLSLTHTNSRSPFPSPRSVSLEEESFLCDHSTLNIKVSNLSFISSALRFKLHRMINLIKWGWYQFYCFNVDWIWSNDPH